MSKSSISTDKAPRPAASYSQAVRAGNILQVAGQGPGDPSTGKLVGETVGQRYVAFPIAADGTLRAGERRVWAAVPGTAPDGCTLDALLRPASSSPPSSLVDHEL